jgi:hypothetical protein
LVVQSKLLSQERFVVQIRWTVAVLACVALAGFVRADDKKDDQPAQAPKAAAVDFRKLKEVLPAELNGLKRIEHTGEKYAFGGMSVSTAKAEYKKNKDQDDEKEPSISVEIMDYGGVEIAKGLAMAWTMAEIDKESDNGYEKTVKIKGNPGMETWEKEGKHGHMQVLVGSRFILTVDTRNIPSEQLTKVVEALPLDKMAALK